MHGGDAGAMHDRRIARATDPVLPRIALVCGNAPPISCGVGDYTTRLAHELRALDYGVTMYTRAQTGVAETEMVRTSAPRFDSRGVAVFAERLRRDRVGVLHLQYEAGAFGDNGFALWRFAVAARKLRVPLVTTFHALDGPRVWGAAHRLALLPALLASRAVVVCSRRQHTALSRIPGVAAKTYLVPVGSAIPVTATRTARSQTPIRLVYFGFVWRGRNLETCVHALAAVTAHIPATLEIVGGIQDAVYRQEITALAQSLGVADKVTFAGNLPAPDVSTTLINADIALLPFASGVSTGRTTFAAALEHGLPVVTMATPANREPEFVSGTSLLSVAPNDNAGFVRETVLLATDAALRERIAAHTPALAALFSWTRIARETARLPGYREPRR